MSDTPEPPLAATAGELIGRLCNEFEAGWRAGRPVPLEDVIRAAPEAARTALLRELLVVERVYRERAGRPLTVAEASERLAALGLSDPVLIEELLTATVCGPTPQARPAFTPRLPESVGGYRVVRELGRGGMGVVYLVDDPLGRRQLAVKVMLPAAAADPTARERFLREAQAAAAVEHDHVVAVYQVGEEGGTPFLVMPLLRGESLEQRLVREPPPPLALALKVGREVALGLQAAHDKGLVHRDVKPSNTWLEGDPTAAAPAEQVRRVKVLDFGLARGTDGPDGVSAAGVVVGTPGYMSPEQARGEAVDARADLFSLGAVLYRMAVGHAAFTGPSTPAVLRAVCEHTPPPPRDANPSVPPALSDLIVRLLDKDRDRRPATAREVASAIEALASERPAPAAPPNPTGERPSRVSALLASRGVKAVRRFLHRYRGAGLGLACAAVAWGLTTAPLTRGVEDWVFDGTFFYRGARPTDARVVIIGLDEPSLRELKKPLAHISPELAEVTRHSLDQGAAVVGLDLTIPEDRSDDPAIATPEGEGDGWRVGQVVDSGKVVLPLVGGEDGPLLPVRQWWEPKLLSDRAREPGASEAARLTRLFGFVDLDADGDQFVRRQRLLSGTGEHPVPQFALALFARSRGLAIDRDPETGGPRVGNRRIPTDAEGKMRINFVGPPGTFPVVPFREALAAARAKRPLPVGVDKAVVIVGVTARSMQDYHATPYSNHYARYESAHTPERMSGPELHANTLATLEDRAFIVTPWWLGRVPLLVVSGVVLGVAFARLSLEAGFAVAVLHHFAWKLLALPALNAGVRYEVTAVLLLGGLVYAATFVRRWRKLRRMFGVVKSEAVVRALEADADRPDAAGEERVATVLVADVRRFADFCERHTPGEVVALQSALFGAIVPCVEAEGGTVVAYTGDGLMAVFGAPATQPDHAARAVRAAAAVLRAVGAARAVWAKLDRAGAWRAGGGMRVGVGVHTGPVVVGAVGSRGRLDYSVTGAAVGAADRLESANKEHGTAALVSNDTVGRVPADERAALKLGDPVRVTLKGDKELTAYPLLAD